MKCPICDKPITDREADYMEHTLIEEYLSCKDEYHNFYSMYAYGATQETIGAVTFLKSYTDSKSERDLVNLQTKLVILLEREAYIKRKTEKRSMT